MLGFSTSWFTKIPVFRCFSFERKKIKDKAFKIYLNAGIWDLLCTSANTKLKIIIRNYKCFEGKKANKHYNTEWWENWWWVLNYACCSLGLNELACVASVSNRVIVGKSERKQKKGSPSPSPSFIFFFCSCPSFLDEPCEETLATQAIKEQILLPHTYDTKMRYSLYIL